MQVTISHLIFLTRDERYALANRENVTTIGVSIPVWTRAKDTLIQANEVFCRYILQNKLDNVRIFMSPGGYSINLPQKIEIEAPFISNEEWRGMSLMEQESWYIKHRTPPTAENLKDIKDGGSAYLKFHYVSLSKELKTIHNIEIKTIESLLQSLI